MVGNYPFVELYDGKISLGRGDRSKYNRKHDNGKDDGFTTQLDEDEYTAPVKDKESKPEVNKEANNDFEMYEHIFQMLSVYMLISIL